MKILYYNWLPFDNPRNEGGGVNIYQKNLIEEMVKDYSHDIYFLSSGWKYNPLKSSAYIRRTKNVFGDKCKSFELINSPMIAPAGIIFHNIRNFLDDTVTLKLFDGFFAEHGPFDIVHLNNVEGISINVLRLKEKYPESKFVMSLHNYVVICPLVNFFQNHNERICHDFDKGRQCLNCGVWKVNARNYVRCVRNYLREKISVKFIVNLAPYLFKFRARQYVSERMISTARDFEQYREKNVEYVNKYADRVLAVSGRVRQIAVRNGIAEALVRTSYIGTKFAERARDGATADPNKRPFTLAYLGYARIDKGFYFMIDALARLDRDVACNIKVKLAAGDCDQNIKSSLRDFLDIEIIPGYSHAQLPEILSGVHLGVVPVLWEDNLPQVAVEMVACGVPILCSSFGGASELCSSDIFKFEGGDENDFIGKLTRLVKEPALLEEYWKYHKKLTTMKEHLKELIAVYTEETTHTHSMEQDVMPGLHLRLGNV
jgi:glycosyltransferase involved in cell wall biosynthesis